MKKKLKTVTLLGIDCVNLDGLFLAIDICQQEFEFADVKILTSIKSDHKNIVPIKPINSVEEYSRFIITELDKYISTKQVLIVQHDGFILNPEQWTDEFLKYDYIGAPWVVNDFFVSHFHFPEELLGKIVVGNGGFSLRSKKITALCAKLAKENAFSKYHPEDLVLCVYDRKMIEENEIKFAPPEVAKMFSFENDDSDREYWNGEFGFHGFKWTDISRWLENHPEYFLDKENNVIKKVSNYKDRKYTVVDYDQTWRDIFIKESDILQNIFGENAKEIEHVGSTAISGLAGKPTIDILVLVEKIEIAEKMRSSMESAGYKYIGEYVKKGAILFVREEGNIRLCNVHIFQENDCDASEMLKIRDYLNQNKEIVKEYSKLKIDLFKKYPADYVSYRKFKDEWMENLIKKIS